MSGPKGATIIVAHPDDEVLWFASALPEAAEVIIAFQDYAVRPGLGERRAQAMADLPFGVHCLALSEAGTFDAVNWSEPTRSALGLKMNAAGTAPAVSEAYARNYEALRTRLSHRLSPDSCVFTHNPWGEYGHADHVQLYQVLESLRADIGFDMWVSGYVSRRTMLLARQYATPSQPILHGRPDAALGARVMEIYQRHDCWTWKNDWVWPAEEYFLPAPLPLVGAKTVQPVTDRTPLCHIPAPEIGPDRIVRFR